MVDAPIQIGNCFSANEDFGSEGSSTQSDGLKTCFVNIVEGFNFRSDNGKEGVNIHCQRQLTDSKDIVGRVRKDLAEGSGTTENKADDPDAAVKKVKWQQRKSKTEVPIQVNGNPNLEHFVSNPEKRLIEGDMVDVVGTGSCPQCKIPYSQVIAMTNIPGVKLAADGDSSDSDGDFVMTSSGDSNRVRNLNGRGIAVDPVRRDTSHNKCKICQKPYKNAREKCRCLQRHFGPFKCPYCENVFKRKDYLQEHSKKVHSDKIHNGRLKPFEIRGMNEHN
ncbi:unnamed protein product [Allacma fusca]|uniref:C2H2-type domain-containing protein n=1 Tax=Allacma fusca TaxID=39272 RepID=A0A8J2PUM8_9HEXA|nr:unnamed protein product [Allacma fusca]